MNTFKLKVCDVILEVDEGTGLSSIVSRWAIGRYKHVFLYLGKAFGNTPFLFESSGRGAVIQNLQAKTGRPVLVLRPTLLTDEQKFAILTKAIGIASSSKAYYDYLAIIHSCIPRVLWEKFPFLPIPSIYIRDEQVICSEAVAEAFWQAGVDVLPKDIIPLPADFEGSLILAVMYEGRLFEDIVP